MCNRCCLFMDDYWLAIKSTRGEPLWDFRDERPCSQIARIEPTCEVHTKHHHERMLPIWHAGSIWFWMEEIICFYIFKKKVIGTLNCQLTLNEPSSSFSTVRTLLPIDFVKREISSAECKMTSLTKPSPLPMDHVEKGTSCSESSAGPFQSWNLLVIGFGFLPGSLLILTVQLYTAPTTNKQ